LPRREHEFEMMCRDARLALRVGEWADASATAMRALGLGRAATLLDVPAEAMHGEFVARLERLRFQALEDRFDARSGWDSTGGVPRACGRGACEGAAPVEWMLPGGHGSADPGLE
jgi:Bacterial transcriptional activator domain